MRISEKIHSLLDKEKVKKGQRHEGKTLSVAQHRRMQAKSLKSVLLHEFLNECAYRKGKITASAIVEDIVGLVQSYFKK